jgi:hypothetical protein
MAAIWLALHPASASRVAAALRRPCAEQCGRPGGSIEVDAQPGEFTEIRVILPRVAAFV